jgi:peptide/nickel transport system substrate-binding protein
MKLKVMARGTAVALAAVATAAVTLTACGSSATPSSSPNQASAASNFGPSGPVSSVGTKVQGGTAYLAEAPGSPPNYIFPFVNAQNCGFQNFGEMFWLMYRPLYWFGNNNSPTVDYNYSIGKAPVFTDANKTVTVSLKNWKWSDGETVTSRDVAFWMNLMKDIPSEWCIYTPGFFPDNLSSVSYPNSSTVVFHFKKTYSQTWILYNELSQITPLPIAWDRTSASGATPSATAANLPDTTDAGAHAVYKYLNGLATNTATYATNPTWGVVDGPWKLESYTSTGEATFVPNPGYSGSPKPTLAKFVEVPFTSDEAILNQVKSGGPSALSQVELPDEYLPQLKSIEGEGYNATNFTTFSFSYAPFNLGNPTFGPVFSQLYFRQSFEHLVDQQGWISKILGGYAVPTYGPVPLAPNNSFADSYERSNPYPFNVSEAAKILKSHGWANVGSGEVAYCAKPGSAADECGAGVKKGVQLKFNLEYLSGSVVAAEETEDLKSQAAQVGIDIELTTAPFTQVISKAVDCGPGGAAKPGSAQCNWTVQWWGAGWIYAPDYAPTGESLFYTGAAANYEGWSSPEADKLINETLTASTAASAQSALDAYQNFVAKQVPVIYFPTATGDPTGAAIVLTSKHLGGYINNVYSNMTPENWYLTK